MTHSSHLSRLLWCGIIGFFISSPQIALSQETPAILSLEKAIEVALEKNPSLVAANLKIEAERSTIRSQSFLDNPMIGYEYEKNFNLLEIQHGPMTVWSISQDIRFPLKYFKLGSIQRNRTRQAENELSGQKLEVRKKVISAYFRAFVQSHILSLLKLNLDSARKTARTAELRHSTGQVPQQDEMKAHVEETRINTEILLAEEEEQTALANLASLLGQNGDSLPQINTHKIGPPQLKVAVSEIPGLARKHARPLLAADLQWDEAELRKSLSGLDYWPDFKLSYRKAFGNPMMSDAHAFEVEFTLPLWFAFKQSAEYLSATATATQAEHQKTQAILQTEAQVRSLAQKAKNHQTLLEIYNTSLIPQATATSNSSEAAYRAGKVSLLELLDSHRALNQTQISYFQTFAEYIEIISELESMTGVSVSHLPFPPEAL